MRTTTIFLYYVMTCTLTSTLYAQAKDGMRYVEGPVSATIIKVIDGDTVLVDATPWPSQTIRVYVRLRDIDTPEIKSRCKQERIAAYKARDALIALMDGRNITLHHISGGKYYGRILADVKTRSGLNASDQMLKIGHARPYKKDRGKRFCQTN